LGHAVPPSALVACGGGDDKVFVSGFTDTHGRVCTFAFTSQNSWDSPRDIDVGQVDCEFPPEGEDPGGEETVQLDLP
jgi:hypothetical protein